MLIVRSCSVREEALATIVTTLSRHYAASELSQRHEELLLLLRRSLSKGATARESSLAAHAISLSFINQGDLELTDGEELYQRVLPALKSTVENTSDTDVKCKVNERCKIICSTCSYIYLRNLVSVCTRSDDLNCCFGYRCTACSRLHL